MIGRIREFAREDCPICGHRQWCGRRDDGLVLCKRPPTPRELPGFTFKGMAADGVTGMYVEAGREYGPRMRSHFDGAALAALPSAPRSEVSTSTVESNLREKLDPAWLTENYPQLIEQLTDERSGALAAALGLPISSLNALAIGWWPERLWWNPQTQQHEGEPGCWTFPEYDAHGRIIGLGLRFPAGCKGQMSGGRRGLILPSAYRDLPDPVLIVEGPSDVLAGHAIGLNVIGRPSNSGGAELLARLCRDRRVIVIGENDRKPDGRWPGREGAEAIAEKLSTNWERPVPIAFPPAEHKDLRAWIIAQVAASNGSWEKCDTAALCTHILDAIRPPAIVLICGPRTRRGGKASVKAFRWSQPPDAPPLHSDRLDLDSARARARFAAAVGQLEPQTDSAALEKELLALRAPLLPPNRGTADQADGMARLTAPAKPVPAATDRPRIQGNERQLRDIRSDAVAALIRANEPPRLFRRAGGIARIVLRSNESKEAVPQIDPLDSDALRGELTNAADWFILKHLKHGAVEADELPPTAIARDILALPAVELPPLTAVITSPIFGPDGNLIVEDGYDPGSGLWHHRTLHDLPEICEHPSQDDIAASRDALADIVAEFPFVDEASRANAYALMLLPFVRPLIDGPTPLHAVDAPTPGTGKGLMVQACLWPALGYNLDIRSGARDRDEWRKRITSELVAGKPVIGFDNATSRLDSEHLAAALTATLWTDRVLGHTRIITIPNNSVWVCTGNNLAFSKELARRVVWIRLDARIEAPEQRTGFRYPNLTAHVRTHRGRLVAAALTICRAWLAAGRPSGTQVMGSFESYAQTIGGILGVAGIDGFLANAGELRRLADTETSEWRAFVHAWWERWHDAFVGVSDLAELLWQDGQRSDLLPSVVRSESQRGAVTQLGMRLSAKRDCIIGGFRIVIGDKADHSDRLVYRLVQTFDEPEKGLQKVCNQNCDIDKDLEQNADLCRPFEPSPSYVDAHMHAHITNRRASFFSRKRVGTSKRSAKVCTQAQVEIPSVLTGADLLQTFGSDPKRSAPTPDIAWHAGGADYVSTTVIELARQRDGWTPSGWHARLLHLAASCQDTNPDRAAELRQAAELMVRILEQPNAERKVCHDEA